jgi:RNA polymerase sigma factor (sigma-70 family)
MGPTCVLGPHGLNENTVLAAAKRGQTAAFDELWQAHTKRILRTTYRITRNREDAEDALQDSFLRAFLHIKDFDGRSSFSTWLTRIAINSALMILRKKRSSFELPMDDCRDHEGNPAFTDVPDRAPDPEAHCAQREREGILRGAIRALRPTIRQAIELQKLQEHSLEETAKMMGLSVGAAKSRLHHGKAALRKSLKPETVHGTRTIRQFWFLSAA